MKRLIATLASPLQRLRKFITQRIENELRHEISALRHALDAQQKNLDALEQSSHEKIRALEIIAAGSHPWQTSARTANTPPYFTIILPTRNRATLIADAIQSVLAQTWPSWELLIIDDGSDDDTQSRLQTFLLDPRIQYHHCDAGGVAAARNHGLMLAQGQLIAYLDSDNAWFPGFLAGMRAEFAADAALDSAYAIVLSDSAIHARSQILWRAFDAEELRRGNYIDLNIFVHRRELVQRHGGFDETLTRLSDWDLILRYTRDETCRRVPVAGAYYRSRVSGRISDTRSFGDNWFRIRQKLRALPQLPRPLKVLYAIWHYPQLSETYIETEIRAMLRFGVVIEVWSNDDVAVPYPPAVPVRRGDLQDAIAEFQPDLMHVHWITSASTYATIAQAAGLPVTVRAHGFEVNPQTLADLLGNRALQRLFLFPRQRELMAAADSRITFMKSVFDTELFKPAKKNRRLVLRTVAAIPSKDIVLFLEAAKRLPEYRFVLIACTVYKRESYVDEIIKLKAELNSPAELYFDMPHARTAEYTREAGIFLHTAVGIDQKDHSPIGMPISIAEAMATGAYVIARDDPALCDYIGDAGDVYADLDQACALIAATRSWDEARWRAAEIRSIDRAFLEHADDVVLQPLHDCWLQLQHERASAARAQIA
ncbi:glycosyltransferase [Pseudolysobacter antarcticus]|uniref:glycosyltransferase n=1 Tax=Pseudolysobacter antarcticus TaxID=2511995 RepID=UPI0013EA3168|nr:glycosyltransferase [Pseudolysobacter antarcticus]